MALVLRRPAGLRNAGLPDAEGRMFALGLRATGTVRGQPKFLADRPWAGPGVVIERARHRIRAGMRRALDGHRYAPVLIALAIGDQAGSHARDWRLFNRSGITHLVSISGMHVTSIAGVAGMLAAFLWRRAFGAASDWPSARRRASWRHGGRLGRVAVLPARGLGRAGPAHLLHAGDGAGGGRMSP